MIDLRRRDLAQAPEEARRLREYALTVSILGEIEADAGREADACPRFAQVIRLFGELARSDRQSRLDAEYPVRLAKERQAKHCQT